MVINETSEETPNQHVPYTCQERIYVDLLWAQVSSPSHGGSPMSSSTGEATGPATYLHQKNMSAAELTRTQDQDRVVTCMAPVLVRLRVRCQEYGAPWILWDGGLHPWEEKTLLTPAEREGTVMRKLWEHMSLQCSENTEGWRPGTES